jgi:tetratricopeptide (TPR) repeat protein
VKFKPDWNFITQLISARTVNANALLSLAHKHREAREFPAARDLYQEALKLIPNDKMIWVYLGETFISLGRADRAFPCYKQAMALDNTFYPAWISMADCSTFRKRPREALKYLSRAEALIDDSPHAQAAFYVSRGNAYYALNEFHKSERDFLEAAEKRPDYAAPHGNLGNIYFAWRDFDKSEAQYLKAYEMSKDPQMALNLGILYFIKGDYKKGWEWYEKRWQDTKHIEFNRFIERPIWKGEETDTLYICGEQGMGDIIHFGRYFKEAKKHCKKLIVETQRAWIPLIEQLEGPDEVVPWIDERVLSRDFTAWLPLMSLPIVLGMPYPEDAPKAPYLEMNTIEPKKRPAFALFWQGNPEHNNDKQRSIPLEAFRPLIEAFPEVYWFTCHPEKQISIQIEQSKLPVEQISGDLLKSARLLGEADLVIACDTGPVHISAAQGTPTWILLPPNPDWRWGLESTITPWYSCARLYRSSVRREWASVIEQVSKDLKGFLDELRKKHQTPSSNGSENV